MNGILFSGSNKSLLFDVSGYQFDFTKKMDEYDANWLTVIISYSVGEEKQTYRHSCLLTFELEDMIEQIDLIIQKRETGFISDFMEPYLKFSITQVDDTYAIQVRFVNDTVNGWKEIYVSQGLDISELIEMNNAFKRILDKFPIRNVT